MTSEKVMLYFSFYWEYPGLVPDDRLNPVAKASMNIFSDLYEAGLVVVFVGWFPAAGIFLLL